MTGNQIRVLLIEDDEDDCVLVKSLLAEARTVRFSFEWAASYQAGLAATEKREHDVYLLDYRLGSHNGLEFIHELNAAGFDAPLIFLTGHRDYEIDTEALQLGAADYLIKGQTNSDLLERSILHAIERKRVEVELNQYRERLEELVQQRTNQLEKTNESLQLEIAERRQVEADRTRLIDELRSALAKVKLLSGLLPICASCKRVRDDKGYWSQIEVYIRDHSEAEFSHGICPDCANRLYPWFLQDRISSDQLADENNKRKHYRHRLRDGIILSMSGVDITNISKIGNIIDISEGGLSFTCRLHHDLDNNNIAVSVYGCVEPRVFIDRIPCKIVYKYVYNSYYSQTNEHIFHRVGVRFGELQEYQRTQLHFLIQYYGTAQDRKAANS